VTSTRKHADHKDFVFRKHQYARVKKNFDSNHELHEFCVDSRTFMFFVDRKFFTKINVDIRRTSFRLEVRDIESKTHDTSKYFVLDLYFHDHSRNESRIAHIRKEFHLVNDLNVNMLIDINILRFEKCIMNFKRKIMIFFVYENTKVSITIIRIDQFVNRSVLFANKIVVSIHINMTMFIKIRDNALLDRNYIFNSKDETQLDLEKKFFNHIMINNLMKVQIRNILDQTYVIFKNYKIERMNDIHQTKSLIVFSKNRHLTIAFNKLSKLKINSRKIQNSNMSRKKSLEIVLSNEIIIHENKETIERITNVIDKYLTIWKNVSRTINISQKRWMRIKTILETNSEACRVYKLRIEDQTIIDKEFDVLHSLNKMKWAFESTSYAYSMFVIWIITHLMRKSLTRRERMIVEIRDLNKISKHDVYSMFLQSNILSKTQNCSYISIMNCTTFFHQWRIIISNKHKLIVIIHRDVE
jgi:hypothetical protein